RGEYGGRTVAADLRGGRKRTIPGQLDSPLTKGGRRGGPTRATAEQLCKSHSRNPLPRRSLCAERIFPRTPGAITHTEGGVRWSAEHSRSPRARNRLAWRWLFASPCLPWCCIVP